MDKEHARFILQSFRPDGADAQDPDFADALALAAADRELGEWLAHERAQDAAFAVALADVEIPDDLRKSILQVLAGSDEGGFSEMDAAFVGALASVRAPAGLRDQIVAAMEMQKNRTTQSAPVRAWKWLGSASIAAAVALGAWLAFQVTPGPSNNNPNLADLTPAALESEAIKFLNASFTLDHKAPDLEHLVPYLADGGVPISEDLPDRLEQVRTLGCKVLKLDGHKAALVCFQLKGNVIHLVVMDLDEVSGEFGGEAEAKKNCRHCPVSGWSRATWTDDERVFLLLGKMKPEEIKEVL